MQRVASLNLRKVAKMTRVARITARENSKVNSKERRATKGSIVRKEPHCQFPKLLGIVRNVHASPKSLRRWLKQIRTRCMTMVL